MTSQSKEIACLVDALKLVKEARSLQEILDIQDRALAIKRFREQADLSGDIVNESSLVRLYAERRLGEFLRNAELAKSSPSKKDSRKSDRSHDATGPVFLKDLGISKSRSSRAQQLALLPQDSFDEYVSSSTESGIPPTLVGALRLAKQYRAIKATEPLQDSQPGFATNLQTLLAEGRTFSTIYADPPWRHDNQASRASASNHYPTMTLEDICREPVSELAAKNCHLHLWATSPMLPEAFKVISSWGFEYKSSFIWVKRQMGLGNYWRGAHELLLTACRGQLAFNDHSQRSWLEVDRTTHSTKPEEIREIIEKVSPGPFLELYGRKPPVNSSWTVYGNQCLREEPRGETLDEHYL
jgi:N6-adenosine-specific RNA methylase IME4